MSPIQHESETRLWLWIPRIPTVLALENAKAYFVGMKLLLENLPPSLVEQRETLTRCLEAMDRVMPAQVSLPLRLARARRGPAGQRRGFVPSRRGRDGAVESSAAIPSRDLGHPSQTRIHFGADCSAAP